MTICLNLDPTLLEESPLPRLIISWLHHSEQTITGVHVAKLAYGN